VRVMGDVVDSDDEAPDLVLPEVSTEHQRKLKPCSAMIYRLFLSLYSLVG